MKQRQLRCDECAWSGPTTRFKVGIRTHTMHDHHRDPSRHEMTPRTITERADDLAKAATVATSSSSTPMVVRHHGKTLSRTAHSSIRDSL